MARKDDEKLSSEKVAQGEAASQIEPQAEEDIKTPEDEPMEIDEDDPEMQAAASRIQAQWKGKQARREVNVKREAKKAEDQLIHEEQSAAAVKIQSRYRGKKARRQVQAKREEKNGAKPKPMSMLTMKWQWAIQMVAWGKVDDKL